MRPTRIAYLGLSDEIQKQNMKKLKVNTEVTAMTTILEFLGHCVIGFLFWLMEGFTEFITLASIMQLHFVILSYVFLMNTEFNKNRILNQGWANVLRNITPFCKKTNSNSVNNQSTQESNYNQRTDDNLALSTYKHSNSKITSTNNTKDSNKNVVNKALQFQVEQQTCSRTITNNDKNITDKTFQRQNNKTSRIHLRTKLLSDLLSRTDDEDRYICTFLKLVELEGLIKIGKSVENFDCTVDEHRHEWLPHFVGSAERKFEKRNATLKKLHYCVNQYDIYEETLEQFISMEESFLEDGC